MEFCKYLQKARRWFSTSLNTTSPPTHTCKQLGQVVQHYVHTLGTHARHTPSIGSTHTRYLGATLGTHAFGTHAKHRFLEPVVRH